MFKKHVTTTCKVVLTGNHLRWFCECLSHHLPAKEGIQLHRNRDTCLFFATCCFNCWRSAVTFLYYAKATLLLSNFYCRKRIIELFLFLIKPCRGDRRQLDFYIIEHTNASKILSRIRSLFLSIFLLQIIIWDMLSSSFRLSLCMMKVIIVSFMLDKFAFSAFKWSQQSRIILRFLIRWSVRISDQFYSCLYR